MGAGIHPIIEIDYGESLPFQVQASIRAFNQGEFFVNLDYRVFESLGYQIEGEPTETNCAPLYASRGLPELVSKATFYRYYHLVEDPEYKSKKWDGVPEWMPILRPVDPTEAESWVAGSSSHYSKPLKNAIGEPARLRVSSPLWHSASYLSLQEVLASLQHCELPLDDTPFEFQLIIHLMQTIVERKGEDRVRLVYWFDT